MRQGPLLVMCGVTGVVLAVSLHDSRHAGVPSSTAVAPAGVLVAPTPGLSPRPTTSGTLRPSPTASVMARRRPRRSPLPSPSARPSRASHPSASPSPSPAPRPSPTRTTAPSVVVNGEAVDTRYGLVQVQITLRAHRIVSADAIDYPQDSSRDREINSYAIPQLDDETVQAQSSQIDTVSGATYTSDGYRSSLQSALDSAHQAGVW